MSTCEASINVVAVHIDNGRDTQYKVSSVSIKAGSHPEECVKIGQTELDSRHSGWSWFSVQRELILLLYIYRL